MIAPNAPSINFEQVTIILKEIDQAHAKVQSDMEGSHQAPNEGMHLQTVIRSSNHLTAIGETYLLMLEPRAAGRLNRQLGVVEAVFQNSEGHPSGNAIAQPWSWA